MKKFALLTAIGLCLGFTACDDYEEPNPASQKNEQEAIFESNGVQVVAQSAQQDLNAITEAQELVPVLTYSLTNFPDGYELSMVMQLSKDNQFSTYEEVETSTVEDVIYAEPSAINAAYKSIVTKDPAAGVAYVRYAAYAVNGKNVMRIGDPDLYFGVYELNLVPVAPTKIIEASFNFEYSKDGANWDGVIPFTHSAASQYDDPSFAFAANFTEDMFGDDGGVYWRIVSASGVVYGVSEEEVFNDNGSLIVDGEAAMSFLTGPVLFTINMEDDTFSYIQAIEQFWTPGNSNGWSFDSNCQTLWTDDYTTYYGYIFLNGEFKFSPNPEWNGDFGSDSGITYELDEDAGFYVGTGIASGSANMNVPTEGVYWVELNYGTRDLKLTECKVIGIIGDFNGWGATEAMTPSADYLTWTGTFHLTAGGTWKFRANEDWNVNLGGDLNDLTPGGANIECAEDGDYTITLSLKARPYTATVVKK